MRADREVVGIADRRAAFSPGRPPDLGLIDGSCDPGQLAGLAPGTRQPATQPVAVADHQTADAVVEGGGGVVHFGLPVSAFSRGSRAWLVQDDQQTPSRQDLGDRVGHGHSVLRHVARSAAMASGTAEGSPSGPSSTSHTPSGNSGPSTVATCRANRVFPTPPLRSK